MHPLIQTFSMNDDNGIARELHSDTLSDWMAENEEAILAWTQTVKMTHYYRRMLLVVTSLAFTASSVALVALMLGNPGPFLVTGLPYTEWVYRGMVVFLSLGVIAGIVLAVIEYSRRELSTRAATMRAIQIVRDDIDSSL